MQLLLGGIRNTGMSLSLLLHVFVAIEEVQLFSNDPSRLQQKRLLTLVSVYAKVKENFAMKFVLASALPCFSLSRNGFMWPPLRPSLQKRTGYHKWLLIRVYPHTGEQSKKKKKRIGMLGILPFKCLLCLIVYEIYLLCCVYTFF